MNVWVVWNSARQFVCGIYTTEEAAKASHQVTWIQFTEPGNPRFYSADYVYTVEEWEVKS